MARLLSFLFLLCAAAHAEVTHYNAVLRPDLQNKSVRGEVVLTLAGERGGMLALDAGALQMEAVSEDGRALKFNKDGGRLLIELPPSSAAMRQVRIVYAGTPKGGMVFRPQANEVFTVFSTSQWMPCIDAPSARAGFELRVELDGVSGAGNGAQVGPLHWRSEHPTSCYLFGFAAAPYREVKDEGRVTLRYLAPQSFSEDEMRRIFVASRDMLAFYEDKAGLPYPGTVYTQVVTHGGAAQEADGFVLLGEGYARNVLQDEKRIWLGAHEFAHQWWGNGVTNADWTHFWLNEGIATFMTAAYLEHRFGRAEYRRQIDAAKAKYETLRAAGKDKALVFPDWDRPTAEDRSIVYDKGAYVVHLLRERLGEDKFWRALRRYTQTYWGKPVTTADFRAAMEAGSGESLADFFAQWVLPAKN